MGPQTDAIPTATISDRATRLVSFELSRKNWLLTVQPPHSANLSCHSVAPGDLERASSRAETLIAAGGSISVQMLNEIASVARRKM